jgi:cytochrome c556
MHRWVWVLVGVSLAGCVKKPQKSYKADEIAAVDSLEELMRVQADRMDPMFAIRDQNQYKDEDFARMSKAAEILQATSKRLEGFKGQGEFDEGFAELARKQGAAADKLSEATNTNSAAGAREALEAMRNNCKACHGVYR